MNAINQVNIDEELAAWKQDHDNSLPDQVVVDTDPKQNTQKSPSRRCTPRTLMLAAILVGGIIAVAASNNVFSTDSGTSSDFDLFDPATWIPRWLDKNPYGDKPYDFSLWDTERRCNGLDLHVINNLEEKWQPFFERSIEDWDNGDPDVLTFNVRKPVWHDPGCEPRNGVLKVCSGDYGETDWIGVNHAVIHSNFILSSVAIMNDFHLDAMSDAAKQNTMCHEIGHGLGLGHWDEDFYNRDLGNCMDYTKKPENNQAPDRSNFLFLEQMYGNTQGTSQYYSNINGTQGLHCASTSAEASEIFKKRKLSDRELSQYAKFMSLSSESIADVGHLEDGHTRHLLRTEHKEVYEQSFGNNGVKILSVYHKKLL